MRPVAMAVQGKGIVGMMKRARIITSRYGVTPGKMDRILHDFVDILGEFNCAATFPITAAVLARSKGVVEKYQRNNIEFAVHGYHHVDHSKLSLHEQLSRLAQTRRVFGEQGISSAGFRSPYLRWSEDTLTAVEQNGFLYDSSQGLFWDVVGDLASEEYRQVLQFYQAVPANDYPALPRLSNSVRGGSVRGGSVLRIPYCLPDDESLIDRLHLTPQGTAENPWLAILAKTYHLGELFTLGLHPERIHLCKHWLIATLERASKLQPSVWMTRLDEVARWWRARLATEVTITQEAKNSYRLHANGPDGLTILARGVKLLTPSSQWDGRYVRAEGVRAEGATVQFEADHRPFIAVSPRSAPDLSAFLRQQGYIVETAAGAEGYSLYLDRPIFNAEDERGLLAQIEESNFPLVRLGRWPHGAKSALVVTGDVDALTIWDYGLRIFGI